VSTWDVHLARLATCLWVPVLAACGMGLGLYLAPLYYNDLEDACKPT
jgi:hypothetical protein